MIHSMRWMGLLVVLATGLVVSSYVRAEDAVPPAEKPARKAKGEARIKGGLDAYHANIAKELGLTGDGLEKFTAAVKAKAQAMAEFKKEHGPKLEEAEKAMKAAEEANDAAKEAEAKKQLKELRDALAAAEAKANEAIHATLSDEQNGKWKAYNQYTGQLNRFRKYMLTDEQKAKVKAICYAQAGALGTAGNDAKAIRKVVDEMTKKVETEVLTDEQRAMGKTQQGEKKN